MPAALAVSLEVKDILLIPSMIFLASNDFMSICSMGLLRRVFLLCPIFGLLSFLFITQVWKRKTLYPRWILLFFPLIPFLLEDVICKNLSGSISIIICGGYLNHILIIFFTASSIALWNKNT